MNWKFWKRKPREFECILNVYADEIRDGQVTLVNTLTLGDGSIVWHCHRDRLREGDILQIKIKSPLVRVTDR